MSKSGLFAHFRSKDEVQLALLDRTAALAHQFVVAPALKSPEGLSRLKTLVKHWFGWTKRAGLEGGCAVAAGMFELDDSEGPVRDRLRRMELLWRGLLSQQIRRGIALGQMRADLDVDQFVWELCGIYLSHHASVRFVRDKKADKRAERAFQDLLNRALPGTVAKRRGRKGTTK